MDSRRRRRTGLLAGLMALCAVLPAALSSAESEPPHAHAVFTVDLVVFDSLWNKVDRGLAGETLTFRGTVRLLERAAPADNLTLTLFIDGAPVDRKGPYWLDDSKEELRYTYEHRFPQNATGTRTVSLLAINSTETQFMVNRTVELFIKRGGVRIAGVDVIPWSVFPGDRVTITVRLVNPGSDNATGQRIELVYRDTVVHGIGAIGGIDLCAGERANYSINWTVPGGSQYSTIMASVDDSVWAAHFELRDREPAIVMDEVMIPWDMYSGQEVSVPINLSNTGSAPASRLRAEFYGWGELLCETVAVRLEPGQNATLWLNWTAGPESIGMPFVLRVAGREISGKRPVFPAAFGPDLRIRLLVVEPPRIEDAPGGSRQRFRLDAAVENVGGRAGTARLVIMEDQAVLADRNITLDAGRVQSFQVDWPVSEEGSHLAVAMLYGKDVRANTPVRASCYLGYEPPPPTFLGLDARVAYAAIGCSVIAVILAFGILRTRLARLPVILRWKAALTARRRTRQTTADGQRRVTFDEMERLVPGIGDPPEAFRK